jgi:F0F1-type ATP synthase assembly protein I
MSVDYCRTNRCHAWRATKEVFDMLLFLVVIAFIGGVFTWLMMTHPVLLVILVAIGFCVAKWLVSYNDSKDGRL